MMVVIIITIIINYHDNKNKNFILTIMLDKP